MRKITNINFSITNACDRRCADCSYNSPNKPPNHVSWAYMVYSAQFFKGYNINITGGEPTVHPCFCEFVPNLRELFKCKILGIETNGYGFTRFPEVFRYFDYIHFSHYLFDEDNYGQLEYLLKKCPDLEKHIIVHVMKKFISRNRIGGGKMCDIGTSKTIAYTDGVIYPCCIGDGFDGAVGVTLSKNWEKELLKIKIPCHKCFLSWD